MKKKFQSRTSFPSDFVLEGSFISVQKEHRSWEKEGVHREMDVLCLLINNQTGAYVCRSFNPSYDFSDFKLGDSIAIPVSEFRIDNGLKTVIFRA